MSAGLTYKIEHHFDHGRENRSRREVKKMKSRAERRRANRDPQCQPLYRKYQGYEY